MTANPGLTHDCTGRFAWAQLEPKRGSYDFDRLHAVFRRLDLMANR
ncbi:beta-galactosidase [Hoeflea sp.]